MKYTIRFVLFLTILLTLVFPKRVDAYLDPGTGSYLLQILVAALFGGLFAIKTWWRQIKNIFTGRKDKKTSEKSTDKNK